MKRVERVKRAGLVAIILLAFLAAACPPPVHHVTVDVCAASGLLPTPWCPTIEPRQFAIGQQPTIPCQVHKEPTVAVCDETGKRAVVGCHATHEVAESEAPEFYCRRHARNPLSWPRFILAWLDGQVKVHRMSDAELDEGMDKVGGAGYWGIRYFYPGWLDGQDCIFPYLREADGRFNLDKPNPAYDANLKRLAIAGQRYEIGVYMDMADNCGWDDDWDFYRHNVNGVYGWQDESDLAFAYWKAAVDRVLADIGGPEGNVIGLGNELRHVNDGDLIGSCAWALAWAGKRVDYLVGLGLERPIPFSGSDNTAHKIMGCVSAEDGYYSDYRFVCQIIHGIGLDSHRPGGVPLGDWVRGLSAPRCFAYSTDGVNTDGPGAWNYIPPEKCGTHDAAGGCAANIEEQIKVIRVFKQFIEPDKFLYVEYLAREISFAEKLSQIQQLSLDLPWRTALELWGVDLRRAF